MRVHDRRLTLIDTLVRSPLVLAVGAAAAGLAVAYLIRPGDLTVSSWYAGMTAVLLAIGLYGSTYAIDLAEIRQHVGTVILAVTVGVFVKAAIIAGAMVAAFHEPEYLVLGIVVAQIDPLSVAAMRSSSHMSERAKSVLSAWASFDDPMTVLLAIYFSIFAFHEAGKAGSPHSAAAGDGALGYFGDVGKNLAFAGAALLLWMALRSVRTRLRKRSPARPNGLMSDRRWRWVICVLLLILIGIAAREFLMLGLAITGLYFRTDIDRVIDWVVRGAFLLAAFALGLLLLQGIHLAAGLLLGGLAFGAQALVGLLIPTKLERTDRIYLALGQQNGITAIILALALQPDFGQTVGIVAPAILTVNLLHFGTNALWNRRVLWKLRLAGAVPASAIAAPTPAAVDGHKLARVIARELSRSAAWAASSGVADPVAGVMHGHGRVADPGARSGRQPDGGSSSPAPRTG
jgi:hypothetical protein